MNLGCAKSPVVSDAQLGLKAGLDTPWGGGGCFDNLHVQHAPQAYKFIPFWVSFRSYRTPGVTLTRALSQHARDLGLIHRTAKPTNNKRRRAWWHMFVILVPQGLRWEEDLSFKASLSYVVSLHLKKKNPKFLRCFQRVLVKALC